MRRDRTGGWIVVTSFLAVESRGDSEWAERGPVSGAPASPGGPFPLVVFSHGSGVSTPARYELLCGNQCVIMEPPVVGDSSKRLSVPVRVATAPR